MKISSPLTPIVVALMVKVDKVKGRRKVSGSGSKGCKSFSDQNSDITFVGNHCSLERIGDGLFTFSTGSGSVIASPSITGCSNPSVITAQSSLIMDTNAWLSNAFVLRALQSSGISNEPSFIFTLAQSDDQMKKFSLDSLFEGDATILKYDNCKFDFVLYGHPEIYILMPDSFDRNLAELSSSAAAIEQFVDELGLETTVDLDGKVHEKEDLIGEDSCKDLIYFYDSSMQGMYDSSHQIDLKGFQDGSLNLSAKELISIIGEVEAQKILNFFYASVGKAPVSKILLRRTDSDGRTGNHLDFHTDEAEAGYKQSTVIVALNADSDVNGGALYYLNRNGPTKYRRSQGKAFAHAYNVLHAVAPLEGSRYSLIICFDQSDNSDKSIIDGTGLI